MKNSVHSAVLTTVTACCLLAVCLCFTHCGESLTAEQAFEKGKTYFLQKDFKLAYKYFKKASDKSKDNPQYHWAAAKTAPNTNVAFIHTKAAWENGLKTFDVLTFLTVLSLHTDKKEKLKFAFSLYEELPEKEKSDMLKGDLFEKFEEYDSCIALWERLYQKDPTPELCGKIAVAYGKKGQKDRALAFLSQCRFQKLLDSKGYLLLAYFLALEYDYATIQELFAEARQYGHYSEKVQLEHAGFFLIEGRAPDAEPLLVELIEPVPGKDETMLNLQARIMLGYVYRANNDTGKIQRLIDIAKKTKGPYTGAELLYYASLNGFIADTGKAFEHLKKAQEELADHPVVDLICAREHAGAGNLAEAVSAYKRLPEVFLLCPQVLIETATALTRLGRYDEALSLINNMHKRERFTKNSLELFRDITFKMKFMKESEAAQKILESEYQDDAGILYSKAVLLIKNGETDKALELLAGLIKKYPQEKQFEIARISVYLAKEDYNRVIDECNKSSVDPSLLRQLKIRAFVKLGKPAMIDDLYQQLLRQKKTPALMLEYAQFLTDSEKYEKAAPVFKSLLDTYKKELEKDTVRNALILNNYAWALLNMQAGHKSPALSIAKRAHELAPDDLHILDTYVYALNQNNRYGESVNLLKDRNETGMEPKLLYYLGTAYDRMGDKNRAVRTYQDALSAIDTTKNKLRLSTNAGSIQKRINELLAEK